MKKTFALLSIALLNAPTIGAWGVRGHTVANLVAVEGLPQDGLAFLKSQEAYIGHLGTIPDTWRGYTEPYLRISGRRRITAGTRSSSSTFLCLHALARSSFCASMTNT